jgi:hypothetical protein
VKKTTLILLLALAHDLFGQTTHKLQVIDQSHDAQVVAAGGRLIADYGSYRLYDVSAAILDRDWGRARDEYNSILLNAARLDTTRPEVRALRKTAGNFAGKRLHLVQFAGPVQPAWRQEVLDAGVQIVSYIPQNTYLVYGNSQGIARLQSAAAATPHIQWEGAYLDDYKTHPAVRAGKTDQFAIQLVADAQANAETLELVNGLKWAPLSQQHRVLDYLNLIARLRAADLPLIAARPDVISIQPYFTPKKSCERQDQIVAGNLDGNVPAGPGYLAWLAGKGFAEDQFAASGFAVDLTDSGIDDGTTTPNHFGLYAGGLTNAASRVVYSRLEGTPNSLSTLEGCDGHGTLNAHIIGGFDAGTNFPFADSAGFAYGLGVCPFARLGASVVFDSDYWTYPSFPQLEADAYNSGARVNNNSWGDYEADGMYGSDSQEYDALVRDAQPAGSSYPTPGNQEMVILFAAGNFGPGGQTVDQPGTAKNVITVGSADNVQLFGGADSCSVGDSEAESANEIDHESSRGPCADGRLKPDLMAPGTHVTGGVVQAPDPGPLGTADPCFTADAICGGVGNIFYPSFQQFYTASSGTSQSTPCVAGGCALLRQYFINQSLIPPSPAMTKAWLMNSARYMTGATADDTLWSTNQGMGEMDLGTAFDGTPRLLRDQVAGDTFTASGQTRTFDGSVANTNLPFRVTLAWTDAPGSTTGAAYNNDLDLKVSVGGQTYLGNVFSRNLSVPGGTADTVNNVESVFCPAGIAGYFTITVNGTSINSIGVPNGSNALLQDFALVVYNAAASGPPAVSPAGAVLTAENCLPANGAIDPGETVTVNLALQNTGTVNATNLVATLLPSGGIDAPSGPAAFGALPADGVPVSQPFTFTAEGTCGDTITATLQLQDGPGSLGAVTYLFKLGHFIATTNFTENFDFVTPPALPSGWTSAVLGGQLDWVTTGGVADTPPNSAFAAATTNAGIADLISPPIMITSSSAQLSFRQDYNLEVNPYSTGECFDGGVLEFQIGTNGFTDILAAGGSFATNGYNETIAPTTASDNPLATRQAWSGNSGGFTTTIVNLPAAAAGTNIVLKWRCATDTGNAYGSVGWWVDTISINDGGRYVCCDGPWQTAIAAPQIQAADFSFSFQTVSNQTYDVQYKNALADPAWTDLETIEGDGQIHFITNVVSSSQGYYRIRSP